MKKAYNCILIANIIIVVFGGLYLSYLQNFDAYMRPPITQNNDIQNLKTDKLVYHIGEGVKVYLDYCKHRQYEAITTWRIINETVITFPPKISGVAPVGCKKIWAEVIVIPERAVLGVHHLEGTSEIKANALKTIHIDFRSKEFEVVK